MGGLSAGTNAFGECRATPHPRPLPTTRKGAWREGSEEHRPLVSAADRCVKEFAKRDDRLIRCCLVEFEMMTQDTEPASAGLTHRRHDRRPDRRSRLIALPSPLRRDIPKSSRPSTILRHSSAGLQSSSSPIRISVGTVMSPLKPSKADRRRWRHGTCLATFARSSRVRPTSEPAGRHSQNPAPRRARDRPMDGAPESSGPDRHRRRDRSASRRRRSS